MNIIKPNPGQKVNIVRGNQYFISILTLEAIADSVSRDEKPVKQTSRKHQPGY